MKVKGFDDKEYPWTLKKQVKNVCSAGHKAARALLKELFPLDVIYEEVSLPGSSTSKNKTLYADFYLRSRSMIVEVQGEQHSQHVPFFHDTKAKFFKGQMRDRVKRDWCELNGITLIELPVGETIDEWRDRIKG